jgi:cell division septum initiation protein DivIVA
VCSSPSGPSIEDIVKQMAANNLQFQQQVDSTLKTLQTQIGQLATLVNAMQQAQGSNQQPLEEHFVFQIDLISEIVDDTCSDLFASDFPSLSGFDDVYSCDICTETKICSVCAEIEAALQVDILTADEVANKVVHVDKALDIPAAPNAPSIEQPPSLELKQLPENMKYAYLEMNEKLPAIISSNLDFDQENKLLQVLRKHKKAFGWTLADIPDQITFTCPFDTFTFRRFFDPGIKGEDTNKNFKFNGYYPKLFHDSPTLEEENVEYISLRKAAYVITYPP